MSRSLSPSGSNSIPPTRTAIAERGDPHTCHAEGCGVRVPPRMFMCRTHWYMVPKALRDLVWLHYQSGQERLDGTAVPSDEYLEVTREAIEVVAGKEGRR